MGVREAWMDAVRAFGHALLDALELREEDRVAGQVHGCGCKKTSQPALPEQGAVDMKLRFDRAKIRSADKNARGEV